MIIWIEVRSTQDLDEFSESAHLKDPAVPAGASLWGRFKECWVAIKSWSDNAGSGEAENFTTWLETYRGVFGTLDAGFLELPKRAAEAEYNDQVKMEY